ncbi:high choriolytic enzyme 1-like [Tubulanus polymorphus]|uniref:high choriolytic enzyme 1-like n=1 Tax=Tubulanus polymorphus TaxID=672921 RepID=UPI003DA48E6A
MMIIFSIVFQNKSEFEEYKRTHLEEFSGKFEGDMAGVPNSFRNAASRLRKWTNGKIYYDMSQMSTSAQTRIRGALKELQDKVGSCIEFIERTDQTNYISIYSGSGCWSYVGMVRNKQMMSLKEHGCLGAGTIQHEFLHALGFQHEQCRSDRDKYLTINWENIPEAKRHNFNIDNTNNQGLPYEYASVMQYGKYAFSSNGKPSMTPKDPNARLGIRKLHSRDIKMVQKLYGCSVTDGGDNGGNGSGGNGGDNGGSSCVDANSSCSGWANYCSTNAYVKKNCKKTCNLCGGGSGGGSSSCKDTNVNCSGWTKYCTESTYISYMKKNCEKTCGFCR